MASTLSTTSKHYGIITETWLTRLNSAPFIFKNFGFQGNTLALLATGVVGVIEFLLTIPAVLYVDKFGRKSILLAGAIGMGTCHFIVAGLVGTYENSWSSHLAAGWVCIVFVWVFIANFAYR